MIKFFRIDERLIHGQIVIKWSRHLSIDHIVVANNAAAASTLIQRSLLMAAPSTIKTAIKTIDDAVTLLNDPRAKDFVVLVLVNSPEDAVELVNRVPGIPFVNIGNYGRIAPEKPGMKRKTFANNIYADEIEVTCFKTLMSKGLKVQYQVTPEDEPKDLSSIIK